MSHVNKPWTFIYMFNIDVFDEKKDEFYYSNNILLAYSIN